MSASSYMMNLVGTAQNQYDRTFTGNQPSGNALVLASGRAISGGRKRKQSGRRRRRSKRGGFMGSVVNQAVVPLALLGLQQTYKNRRHGHGKSTKNRRRRRSLRRR